MNIKKKIRKAYESVPMPAAEDVLPEGAFEKKEKRGFAFYRPVIYVAAALCICVIVTVAAVMNKPGENVIADDTTETKNEVTTCEEVYVYLKEDVYDDALDGLYYPEPEPIKVLVKTSDGRELVGIEAIEPSDEEINVVFKEKYGFDGIQYMGRDYLDKLYKEDIINNTNNFELALEKRDEISADWYFCKLNVQNDYLDIIVSDCGLTDEDKCSAGFYGVFAFYASKEDIENVEAHKLTNRVVKADELLESITEIYQPH